MDFFLHALGILAYAYVFVLLLPIVLVFLFIAVVALLSAGIFVYELWTKRWK